MADQSPVSWMVAVLLCTALPAWSQDTLHEGHGNPHMEIPVLSRRLGTLTPMGARISCRS